MHIPQQSIDSIWYRRHFIAYLLLPLSGLYLAAIVFRRWLYSLGLLPIKRLPVANIVVGNLTVGGTGKTPLVIWLANYLKSKGYKPGIISRGYRGKYNGHTQQVNINSSPALFGDEPVLIARHSTCPVAVSSRRYLAAMELIERQDCDIIISDDGLQHYRLYQDIRICVIDGQRRLGNHYLLPAGPLREPQRYLEKMDIIITNGDAYPHSFSMQYQLRDLVNLKKPEKKMSLSKFKNTPIHAVAGIGNPDRFFASLRDQGLDLIPHVFPDHHCYSYEEINFNDDLAVIMTEKDAVKCTAICTGRHWFLPIDAQPSTQFTERFNILLKEVHNGQKIT